MSRHECPDCGLPRIAGVSHQCPPISRDELRKMVREEIANHRPVLGTRHCHRCQKAIHATDLSTMSATVVYCSIECAD